MCGKGNSPIQGNVNWCNHCGKQYVDSSKKKKKKKEKKKYRTTTAATTAAKLLQSCPTLCNPRDGSPSGSAVPGILQARTLEWVAISFSNAWSEKWKWSHSVMSDFLWPHELQPTRLLHPWDFPGKSTGVGCHHLLRELPHSPAIPLLDIYLEKVKALSRKKYMYTYVYCGLPRWLSVKESACQCRRYGRPGFCPWVQKSPWRRKWQSTPVFLPGKSHGQRSLEGYCPWGLKRVRHDLVTKQQQMFTATLFTIATIWKQSQRPSIDEWIRKCGMCIYIFNGILFSHKRIKYCHPWQHGWTSRILY